MQHYSNIDRGGGAVGTLILRHLRHAIWVILMQHGKLCLWEP